MKPRRVATCAVVAFAVAATLAACGGSSSSQPGPGQPNEPNTPTTRALTDEDVQRMVNVLYKNGQALGGQFELNAQLRTGETVNMVGEVDWKNSRGRAVVTSGGTNPATAVQPFEVMWTPQAVLERHPELSASLATVRPTAAWLVRQPQPDHVQLDLLISFVSKLAAEQPENEQLLIQAGVGWLRSDTARDGTVVDVYRYQQRQRYWIGHDDGLLRRLEAQVNGYPQDVLIDLGTRGAPTLSFPPAETGVVYIEELADDGYGRFVIRTALLGVSAARPVAPAGASGASGSSG